MTDPITSISCKKATVLMSKSMERKLCLKEQTALAAHLAICRTCTFCFRQIKTVKNTIAHYADAIFCHSAPKQCQLSDKTKQHMKRRLGSDIF